VAVQAQSAALAAEVAALRSDGGWERLAADNEAKMQAVEAALVARYRAEAECFAASMCEISSRSLAMKCDDVALKTKVLVVSFGSCGTCGGLNIRV
jgi:hypothetical protein